MQCAKAYTDTSECARRTLPPRLALHARHGQLHALRVAARVQTRRQASLLRHRHHILTQRRWRQRAGVTATRHGNSASATAAAAAITLRGCAIAFQVF
jgi:hypothetical protein